MADELEPPAWVVERPGLTALAVLSAVVAALVLLPYLQFVLLGVVLAYIVYPLQERAERYVRPTFAALSVVAATLLLVLLPLVYVISVAVRQSLDVVRAIRQGAINIGTIEELLAFNGYAVDISDLYQANQGRIASAIQQVTSSAIDFAGSLPGLFIGLTVMLFVLFALLRDGPELVAWVQWVLPVEDELLDELRAGLDELMWASVVGNVAVAAIQAVMLGVGLVVTGVPAVVFLTVTTFVLTLLPLVGAFGVWVPASVYLVAINRPTAGAALAVYGLLVTFSDSYLRPMLIGRTSAFNSAIVVVGIFGGLVVFGAVGLFIGPVVLGGAKLALDLFGREHTGTRGANDRVMDVGPDGDATGDEPDGDATDEADADADDADGDSEAAD